MQLGDKQIGRVTAAGLFENRGVFYFRLGEFDTDIKSSDAQRVAGADAAIGGGGTDILAKSGVLILA